MIRNFVILVLLAIAAITLAQESRQSPAENAAQPTQAQAQATAPAQAATVLKFTSRLVVVDVIATDNKGNPVTDLKREDFTLQEDGKDQEIRVFEFESPNHSSTPATEALKPAKLPPNIFTNAPQSRPSRILNVVLLDALNSKTVDQKRAREQMLQ